MIESQQVQEWMAMGEAKREARGKIEGELNSRIDSLLGVLAIRFPPGAPADLEAAIRSMSDREQLRSCLFNAVKADSLDAFRQAAWL